MARLADIDEWLEHYIKTLLAYYRDSDPANGPDGERSKHRMAEHAIDVSWYLHGKLMSWAQAHMTGYAILSEIVGLAEFLEQRLGQEIDEDSHVLEQIGLLYNHNPPDPEDPNLTRIRDLLEEFANSELDESERLLGPQAMRHLMVELLMSHCADNSYWRHELQYSFKALNEGEQDGFSTPSPGKRQGMPYSLGRWKLEALRQVRFRVGAGMKKYRALEEVGGGIGQSPETLRAWEKELIKSPDRENDLYCCELAGQFGDKLNDRSIWHDENIEKFGWHRGDSNIALARYLYPIVLKRTFDEIRQRINRYRLKENGG